MLLDVQLIALSREIVALRRVTGLAKKAEPWGILATEQSAAKQEAAVNVLAYLAESWIGGRTPAEEIDFLMCGIDHRSALEFGGGICTVVEPDRRATLTARGLSQSGMNVPGSCELDPCRRV